MGWLWNLIHFNFYVWQRNAHRLFNYINPVMWIVQIPFIKKFYARQGIKDMRKHLDKSIFDDKINGVNIIWAGIASGSLLVIFEYGVFNIIQGATDSVLIKDVWKNATGRVFFVLCLLIPSALFNYFILFREDRYLRYFREFEKWHQGKRIAYGWMSFGLVILILAFTVFSFRYVPNSSD